MKKIAIYFYLFFIFNTANAFETVGKQAILIDYDTNEILYEKNAHEKAFPSSMTKIMTAFIVFEKIHNKEINLSDKFFISNNAWKQEGSRMFLNVGSKVSVNELLKGLLVQSGNDSAVALSDAEKENIISYFNKKLNKTIDIIETINKELVGGLIIKYEGKIIDGSLFTKQETLKEYLKK